MLILVRFLVQFFSGRNKVGDAIVYMIFNFYNIIRKKGGEIVDKNGQFFKGSLVFFCVDFRGIFYLAVFELGNYGIYEFGMQDIKEFWF